LRSTSDLGDKVIPHTSSAGAREIHDNIEQQKSALDSLKQDTAAVKLQLENSITHWVAYQRSYEQLGQWLKDTEVKVKADGETKSDLAEKKAYLEKIKVCCFIKTYFYFFD
jgi:regulator of replication initiation timing